MWLDWTFNISDIISGLALLISIVVLARQIREFKRSGEDTDLQLETLRHTALIQGYAAEAAYHGERIKYFDGLKIRSEQQSHERAEHEQKAKNAAKRIDDEIRHIEELERRREILKL
jgi:hypothetical protein